MFEYPGSANNLGVSRVIAVIHFRDSLVAVRLGLWVNRFEHDVYENIRSNKTQQTTLHSLAFKT